MRSRAVRSTLTLLAVGAIGTAAWFYWAAQTRLNIVTENAAGFDRSLADAARLAMELRASQQGYVAAGQNEAFWFEKVTTSADALRVTLPALEAASSSASVRSALNGARQALQEFEDRDKRVRSYASSGQRLLASDIIFSDSLETTTALVSALDEAGKAASLDRSDARVAAVREQMVAAGSAGAFVILVMLLLTPVRTKDPQEALAAAPAKAPEDTLSLDLRPTSPPMRKAAETPKVAPPVSIEAAVATGPAVGAARQPAPSAVELQDLAGVCTELARLNDTSTMPAILEKTAAALDASGLVLWLADPDGKELTPIIAHGYPASLLARMGTLPADAQNATAAAFRTGLLQTVSAGNGSSGAIAAPLVSPSGCVGVMSAEVRHEGEHQSARLAAATIIAAQLAAIVGPPAARAEDRNTAAM